MPRPRKRKRPDSVKGGLDARPPTKKGKTQPETNQQSVPVQAQHAVLNQFYPHVLTLRNYVLSKLPTTSRLRRKKVAAVGIIKKASDSAPSDVERSLGSLLDGTLVGIPDGLRSPDDHILTGWKNFSQKGDESYVTLSNGVAGFVETQALNTS
ncbi:uncharacterized protein GGS22DRAFT_8107 [Annulohypoxylon maeteangense]|uniref:uncharacterized protein n=1 Tax=Annulohypoxylon maeteangense TaxID=1927788 RepID=UPI002008B22B|nr:uncharacterized protein GGS22DRAFT_8107 [Annulohypoxylon maeteangense]KAI0890081.1 hypothetical protein GGS22DRAFT_8107 [Annulohypoxylon maeteangense]